MQNCKDPENRSKKACCCGGHQGRRGNMKKRKSKLRYLRRWLERQS